MTYYIINHIRTIDNNVLQHNWIILTVVRPMQPAQAWLPEIPFMQGSVCTPLRP